MPLRKTEMVAMHDIADSVCRARIHFVTAKANDRLVPKGFIDRALIDQEFFPRTFVQKRCVTAATKTGVSQRGTCLFLRQPTLDLLGGAQRRVLGVPFVVVEYLNLASGTPCVKIRHRRAQLASCPIFSIGMARDPNAELVALQTEPEVRHENIAKIVGRSKEMADMVTPSHELAEPDAAPSGV